MKAMWISGLLVLGLVACAAEAPVVADAPIAAAAELQVVAPWSRGIPAGAPVAAGFMLIDNKSGQDDRLVAVRSQAAERVEIHEVRHEDGMARMRELVDGLPVAAGQAVELKPGGYHLMFITPAEVFVPGNHVEATLVFERRGEVPVSFEVRDAAATSVHGGHGH